MFYDSADRQTKLRIRCEFDGLSQSQFFRLMISGYIDGDDLIHAFLDKCKEKYKIQGKQKRNKIRNTQNKAKDLNKKFALESGEIESIFDIIETETGL